MISPRHAITAAVAPLLLLVTACSGEQSSASQIPEPPATIGLGSDVGGGGGLLSGSADVRAIDAGQIDTIVMIGDSITVASTPALEVAFEALGFENVLIESKQGKRIAQNTRDNPSGAAIAGFLLGSDEEPEASDADHSNELWIVALGTNDIGQYAGPQEVAAAVNEVLDVVPDDAALVWVDTYWQDEADATDVVNSVIRARVDNRGNAVVAPWSAVAGDDGVLRSDGVHPSTDGTETFAAVVSRTVADFLQRD